MSLVNLSYSPHQVLAMGLNPFVGKTTERCHSNPKAIAAFIQRFFSKKICDLEESQLPAHFFFDL